MKASELIKGDRIIFEGKACIVTDVQQTKDIVHLVVSTPNQGVHPLILDSDETVQVQMYEVAQQ